MKTINELLEFCDRHDATLSITPHGEGYDRTFEIDLASEEYHAIRFLPHKTIMTDVGEQFSRILRLCLIDIDESKIAEAARKIESDEIMDVKRHVCRNCTYPACEGIEKCKQTQRYIKLRRNRNGRDI